MLVLALMMIQLGGGSSGSGLKLEEVYVKADALRYGAYKISRTYDAKKMQSVAIIRRSGRVLATHDHGEGLAFSASRLRKVVFRYNKAAGKYYPEGHRYSGYLLQGIAEEIKKIKDDVNPLVPVLDVMLRYIYAGEKQRAWSIFERYYTARDNSRMRRAIRQRLKTATI